MLYNFSKILLNSMKNCQCYPGNKNGTFVSQTRRSHFSRRTLNVECRIVWHRSSAYSLPAPVRHTVELDVEHLQHRPGHRPGPPTVDHTGYAVVAIPSRCRHVRRAVSRLLHGLLLLRRYAVRLGRCRRISLNSSSRVNGRVN